MAYAVDFFVNHPKSMSPFGKQHPSVEIEMAAQIDDRTRVPLSWVFSVIICIMVAVSGVIGGAVLYVTDIKTSQAVASVQIANLDARVNGLEGSMQAAILEIKGNLKDLADYVNNRERRENASQPSNNKRRTGIGF